MSQQKNLIADLGVLVSIGLILSIIEASFPPIVPLPGARLGLANIATVIALLLYGPKFAIEVTILRTLIGGLLKGSVIGLFLGFSAGIASTLVMIVVYELLMNVISPIGLSVIGAATHNITQLCAAFLFISHTGIFIYAPYLLLISIPTGLFVGFASARVSSALKTHLKETAA